MQHTKQFSHAGLTFQIIVDLQSRRTIIENKIVNFNNIQISDIPYGRFNLHSEVSDFETKKTILSYQEQAKEFAERQSGSVDVNTMLQELGFIGTGYTAPPQNTNISGFSQQEQMASAPQIKALMSEDQNNMVMNEIKKMHNPFADLSHPQANTVDSTNNNTNNNTNTTQTPNIDTQS